MLNYIYLSLLSFLRLTPGKDYASGWAAAFTPLFFVSNTVAALYVIEIVQNTEMPIPGGKIIVGTIAFVSSAWAYFHYEISGNGREIAAKANGRKSTFLGGVILFESLCVGLLPGLIAVIKNPNP